MMYWNLNHCFKKPQLSYLNQNIWCIEMTSLHINIITNDTWTKTYDVLKLVIYYSCISLHQNLEPKHMMYWNYASSLFLRSAFAWTKTYDVLKWCSQVTNTIYKDLNQNIWCIEILMIFQVEVQQYPWTKTYDVLKSKRTDYNNLFTNLEPKHMMYWNKIDCSNILVSKSLNQNIWCIEIF